VKAFSETLSAISENKNP